MIDDHDRSAEYWNGPAGDRLVKQLADEQPKGEPTSEDPKDFALTPPSSGHMGEAGLIGHEEELTFLLHRHKEYGDHWVMVRDDQQDSEYDDAYAMMRDRVIDCGGALYYIKAKAVVVSALLEEGEEETP